MNQPSPFDPLIQSHSIESKIVVALERISEAFRVLLWQESKTFSLTPIQIQILIFLYYHSDEKRKISYLAQEFNLSKATISDTIKTLENKQLIRKTVWPEDTRSYTICLTKKGQAIAEKTTAFAKKLLAPIEHLHADEKEKLLLSLIHIIYHLYQSGVITIQRMCMTCTHYRAGYAGHPHFCRLLNQPLLTKHLRVDCPEHASK